jgi:hypothetical protein
VLTDDGTLYLLMYVDVGLEGVMESYFTWSPSSLRSAPVGSITAEIMLDEGVGELVKVAKDGAIALIENLPDLGEAEGTST